MKPRSAKNKGKKHQNWVRDLLLSLSKDLDETDIKSTTMGEKGEDIQLSSAARKQWPFQIECKSKAKYSVYKDYAQASSHGRHEPILVIKQNDNKPLVVCDAEWFFENYKHNNNKTRD